MVATGIMVSSVSALLLLVLMTLSFVPSVDVAKDWALLGCQATCGRVDVPYPFGIGANCFRPGFEITCDGSSVAFLAGMGYKGPLFVVGYDVTAYIQNRPNSSRSARYPYEYYTGCVSYCRRAEVVRDGRCAGVGCCRVDIPLDLTDNSVGVDTDDEESLVVHRLIYDFSPCSYEFLVERNSYIRSRGKPTMPVWLDWAIRPNGASAFTCSDAMKSSSSSYACKSQHSSCVDAVNGPGYTCNCSHGYESMDVPGSYDCKCKRGSHGNPLQQKCDPNFSRAAKIWVGVICGISCVIALSIFIFMMNEKRKLRAFFERNGGPLLASINNIKIYTKKELHHITRNYSTVIGKGSLREVYKGTTNDNQIVAVKKLSTPVPHTSIYPEDRQFWEIRKEFANEIKIQSEIKHRNILRLLGCCLEVEIPMLVYEFAPKGSLCDVLHGTPRFPLPLQTRLDIAAESASALDYLHLFVAPKIFHGDVKSGNILLDENFMPKVSDFGTSRLLSIEKMYAESVTAIADPEYLDPVYARGLLNEKSDVYSYGIVLLELITRKKPSYAGNNSLKMNFTDQKACEMHDEEIAFPAQNIELLHKVGLVAIDCLAEQMDDRPSMKQVAESLESIRRECERMQGKQGDQVADGTLLNALLLV
ncbi:wall-associated receptor kinase 3-like [Miscanthus floridulus]|uniref:wall-associated receptor kinase 3-like n=1 Tax=Miscanthus floridulus TaxID=154761 RepID=UPI003458A14E